MDGRTIIIGGGIAGLAAAWELHRRGEPFVLLEAGERLGGTVQTLRRDGFIAECGPDSFLTSKLAALELCRELGLEDEAIPTLPAEGGPRLLQGGQLVALDMAAARGLDAPVAPGDESVAAYLRRTGAGALLDNPVAPMLAGVYGGDAEQLSATAWQQARRGMRGAAGFTSLREGMESLVAALARQLPAASLRLGARVAGIRPGHAVEMAGGEVLPASSVIVAAPAWSAAEILAPVDRELAATLGQIPCASSVNVNVAYAQAPALPGGHGFLAARGHRPLLACTFAHQKFASRTPAGGALVRLFYGEEPGDIERDLRLTMRMAAPPLWIEVHRCPRAMPQYTVGHLTRVAAIEQALARHPGLTLAGNAYHGVGVPDCIVSGRAAANAVLC